MSGGSNTSETGESLNTSAAGEPENTSEGLDASRDSIPEVDPVLRKTFHDEGFDNGLGKGRGLERKEWLKALGVRSLDEAIERVTKTDAKVAEVSERVKKERETASAAADELSNALARVAELEAAFNEREEKLATYEMRAEQALLDRVRAAAASADKRVLPGKAMDLFVAAVRDRVRWNDEGTDVVVMSTTNNGHAYADKTKTLSDLVTEAYEEMAFLFEPSGRKGAGTELGPGEASPSNPFAPGGETFRERMERMKSR